MGNLKEIRNRITSVSSTQKITSAMKLVSAAKLRRAQTAILNLRPYANKLNEILGNLSSALEENKIPLFENREAEKVALVVITSNRGLCGSFNANIIKEVNRVIQERYLQHARKKNIKFYCIGKKGYEQIIKNYEVAYYNDALIDAPAFEEISAVAEGLMADFLARKIDKVEIIYNEFVNPATQNLTVAQFLPVTDLKPATDNKIKIDYIFEPSQDELLEELIPKILKIKLFKSLIDSVASEHGARMTSMAKATDNASDMLKELKLKYNNARQSSITNELLEIISGANALDG